MKQVVNNTCHCNKIQEKDSALTDKRFGKFRFSLNRQAEKEHHQNV